MKTFLTLCFAISFFGLCGCSSWPSVSARLNLNNGPDFGLSIDVNQVATNSTNTASGKP